MSTEIEGAISVWDKKIESYDNWVARVTQQDSDIIIVIYDNNIVAIRSYQEIVDGKVVVSEEKLEELKQKQKRYNYQIYCEYLALILDQKELNDLILTCVEALVNGGTISNEDKNTMSSYVKYRNDLKERLAEVYDLIDKETDASKISQYILSNQQPVEGERGYYYGDVLLKNSSLCQDIETVIKLKTCSDTDINDAKCFVWYTNSSTGKQNSARIWGNFSINEDLSITYKVYAGGTTVTRACGQYWVVLDGEKLSDDVLKLMSLIDVEKADDKTCLNFKDCELIDGAYKYTGNLEFDNWNKVFAYGD